MQNKHLLCERNNAKTKTNTMKKPVKKDTKYNYYEEQLNKIDFKSDYAPKFKVTDAKGNETKWMDLNAESIEAILQWLNKEIKESIKAIDTKKTKTGSLGATKNATDSILYLIEKNKTIDEKTLKLLLRRKNSGEKFDDSVIWDNEIELSKDQTSKGLKWLKNLWKSPTGKERSTNPFGSREESIIEQADTMYLKGFYDAGNNKHSFWVPLYAVSGDNTTMEYYVSGGKINIVG